MTPENIPPSPENHATSKKTTIPKPPQEQPLKCPRCDSSNTKFCYYNNYSLTQPRHFCKTCRRYWTRGGALRSVPIGGGCRKTTKKLKTAATTTNTTSAKFVGGGGAGEFGPGFKFLSSNLNPGSNPATEFNLGGLSPPRLHPATAGVYTQFITSSVPAVTGCGPYFGLDLMGLNNNHTTSPSVTSSLVIQGISNEQQNPISSIESLSSINQEMHWKLQQQRLGLIYEENKNNNDQEKNVVGGINLFNNLEINNISINNNININNNMHGVWGDLHQHNHEKQVQFHGLQ